MTKKLVIFLSAIGLFALFVWIRAIPTELLNIDETIPVEVSRAMEASGRLDPNWANADLASFLKYDQYNFYFYNIIAHFGISLGDIFDKDALESLRLMNFVFQFLAIVLIGDGLRRLKANWIGVACGVLSACLLPLWVQDAAMARPESLIYLLMALLTWTAISISSAKFGPICIGFVVALGVAIKFSFFVFAAPIAALWLYLHRQSSFSGYAYVALMGALGSALGLLLAMPYAILNIDVYLSGLTYLLNQYSGQHPPHSRLGATFVSQLFWIGSYFSITAGGFLAVTIAGSFAFPKALSRGTAFLVLPFLVTLIYFATKPVFFERNFSQSLPSLCFAFGLVIDSGWKTFKEAKYRAVYLAVAAPLLAGSAFQMLYWSHVISDAALYLEDRRAHFEIREKLADFEDFGFVSSFSGTVPDCGRIAVIDYNDPWTRQHLLILSQSGFNKVAEYRSVFSRLPTSTLHTYLDSDVHYLIKSCD